MRKTRAAPPKGKERSSTASITLKMAVFGANAKRKRQHNNSGEARGLCQHPDCGPNVLNQRPHGVPLLRQDRKRNFGLAVSIRGSSLTPFYCADLTWFIVIGAGFP
jgi:hypothetical protein